MTDEPGFRPETLSTWEPSDADDVKAVREGLRRGRSDGELLDGRDFDERAWDAREAALDRLAARLAARLREAVQAEVAAEVLRADLEVEREMREHADVEAETAREQRDAAEAREAALRERVRAADEHLPNEGGTNG